MLILVFILVGWAVTLVVAVGPRVPLGTALHNSVPGMVYSIESGLSRYFGPYPYEYLIAPLMELPCWMPPIGLAGLCVLAHIFIQRKAW